MPRVFISTLQLLEYRDETLVVLDLVDAFLKKNWHVDIYCHQYDATVKTLVAQRSVNGSLFITNESEHIFSADYDLLWLQYSSLNSSILNRLLNGGMTTNIIFDHQSLDNREIMPADIHMENRLADKALVTVPRLTAFLQDCGVDSSSIQVFPNPVPSYYFTQQAFTDSPKLDKLLIVTDCFSSELNSLSNELASFSISCDLITKEQWSNEVYQGYSAILANGRIAQYALCSGIPVYIYSGQRFAGYVFDKVTEGNVFREETSGKLFSDKELAEEIIQGYTKAYEYTKQKAGFYKECWHIDSILSAFLEELPVAKLKTISDQELQRLTLHNLTLQDKTKPFYSVDKWLSERLITPTRRDFLHAFIEAYPEIGNIAVVVMAKVVDAERSISVSLESIRKQFYAASEVYVLGSNRVERDKESGTVTWLSESSAGDNLLNTVISQTSSSYLLVMQAGDELLPHTLLLLAEYRLRFPSARAFYFDESIIKDGKAENPILKPECNIDMLRSYPYIGRSVALDIAGLHQVGMSTTTGCYLELYDIIWQLLEQEGPQALGHIPEVLVYTQDALFDWLHSDEVTEQYPQIVERHLARCNVDAHVSISEERGICRIQYHLSSNPLISIIIPTRDHLPVISRCIETLLEHTRYPHYELLIVDNGSTEPGTCQYLTQLATMGLAQLRVISWPHPFNFSAINNFAAEQANGDVLLFLNNDTEIIDGEWLEAMLRHVLRPEVGIVGAKLSFEDGCIQHGGIVLGMNDSASISFQGMPAEFKGYMNRLCTTHNVSAVTGACMMMRRDVYTSLGGFDEHQYPIYFGDVDIALKARQQGYLIVWTPDAKVMHLGGASRLLQQHFNLPALPQHAEIESLYDKWLPQLANDPCYHPAYGKHSPGFSLTPEMARCQRPLPGRPLPVVMGSHSDWHGCGHYRVIFPFQALEREMHIEGGLKHGTANLVDIVDIAPDVVIVQSAAGARMPEVAARYRKYTQAAIVAEFDDYILNVPINSGNRKIFSQQLIKNFRRSLESVDWVVVSTPALADAYSAYHSDIRVAYNRLPASWWKGLTSLRRQGKKPRVGWAGGSSHKGDLAILRSVVKALENEVEWVFMGMKPEGVKCEFHAGVPIDYYPQKTASLNLDLALVPLEYNQFNECKSNLRLMELGACGIPVICTDIEPYRCGLPVTRVDNRFKDWMDAIRMHLAEMSATERMGDQLRDAVYKDWMLEGDGLTDWIQAWLPK